MYLFSDCEEDFSSPEVLLFLHKNTSLLVQVLPCTLGCLTLFTRIIISFGYAVFKVHLLTFVSSTMGSHEPPVLFTALYFSFKKFLASTYLPVPLPAKYFRPLKS